MSVLHEADEHLHQVFGSLPRTPDVIRAMRAVRQGFIYGAAYQSSVDSERVLTMNFLLKCAQTRLKNLKKELYCED